MYIFLIHFPQQFTELGEMTECWNMWAKEAGFEGIYFMVVNPDKYDVRCDARVIIEPQYSMRYLQPQRNNKLPSLSYDDIWERILSQKVDKNITTYLSGFVDYDETPRRGEYGTYCRGVTPEKFEKYFSQLVDKCMSVGSEFIFLNAWNEWGEGMYLEPDQKNGYGFLQAVKNVLENYPRGEKVYEQTYLITPQDIVERNEKKIVQELELLKIKYNIINNWFKLKERDLSVAQYLYGEGYRNIAIYGLGVMGKHLISDISKSMLKVLYGIDQKADTMEFDFAVYTLKDDLPKADVIVVALAAHCDEVISSIQNKVNIPVISLEELLCRVCEYYIK